MPSPDGFRIPKISKDDVMICSVFKYSWYQERAHLASEDLVQDAMSQHLKAAAAAYVAVHVKGRAMVELQKDATMLGQRGDFHAELMNKVRIQTNELVDSVGSSSCERCFSRVFSCSVIFPPVLRFKPKDRNSNSGKRSRWFRSPWGRLGRTFEEEFSDQQTEVVSVQIRFEGPLGTDADVH